MAADMDTSGRAETISVSRGIFDRGRSTYCFQARPTVTLNLPDQEVAQVFHGLGTITQSAHLYVEDMLIIFLFISMRIAEEVNVDEKEEWQWQRQHIGVLNRRT
jgi:hypothetical protein